MMFGIGLTFLLLLIVPLLAAAYGADSRHHDGRSDWS
jgi:hypothetical protein